MRLAVAFIAVLGPLVTPLPASADLEFEDCGGAAPCATVTVPLDRSGAVPGSVDLHVERYSGEDGARGALFVLAGGPGQAATPLGGDFQNYLGQGLGKKRSLIVLDARGTGQSDVLDCPRLQRAEPDEITDRAAACAASLGPKRAFYTAREMVADIEAVRQALEIDKISLYGVSYGVKLALNYAAAHPTHVERLVLDSVLNPAGPDPFYRASMAAAPRILRALCRGRCGGITSNPAADVAKVVEMASEGDLDATAYDGRGRPHPVTVTSGDLFTLLHEGDLFPTRGAMPALFRSAALGDTALLARRLYVPAYVRKQRFGQNLEEFSQAMFAAATCEETELPWERTAPIEDRKAQAAARAALLPKSVFQPFDAAAALASDTIRMCLKWPASAEAPVTPVAPLPDVPVLIINGENDMRTPLSSAQAVADQFPRSTMVTDAVGHSVLFASDCAFAAVEDFFKNREPGTCKRVKRVRLTALPPASAKSLRPLGETGAPGRTLRALQATLGDIELRMKDEFAFFSGRSLRGGGFRGGWMRVARAGGTTLGRYVFVPGVAVSGKFKGADGEFTISGSAAARGKVVIRGGRLTGQLDGRPVSARVRVPKRV